MLSVSCLTSNTPHWSDGICARVGAILLLSINTQPPPPWPQVPRKLRIKTGLTLKSKAKIVDEDNNVWFTADFDGIWSDGAQVCVTWPVEMRCLCP